MSNDKMRAEFEEWIDSMSYKQIIALDENSAWQAWQASRASRVVELPDFFVFGIDAALYRDDIIDALDTAGVAYK